MAETTNGGAEKPPETEPQAPAVDRGMARALLQRRVEAARSHPDWPAAMSMATFFKESDPRRLEVIALKYLEKGILTVSDLFRVWCEFRDARVESRPSRPYISPGS